jgi:hypothetical protein
MLWKLVWRMSGLEQADCKFVRRISVFWNQPLFLEASDQNGRAGLEKILGRQCSVTGCWRRAVFRQPNPNWQQD